MIRERGLLDDQVLLGGTSMLQLHLAMLQRMGVPCDRFGEAEIALEGIS
jgi:hypothetical protein